jgi:hypothetical protein
MTGTASDSATAPSNAAPALEEKYDGWWGSDRDGDDRAPSGHDPNMALNDREKIIAHRLLKGTAELTCPIAKQEPQSDADLHDGSVRVPVSEPCEHVPLESMVTEAGGHNRDFAQHPNRKRVNLTHGYIVDGPHLEDRPAAELRNLLETIILPHWRSLDERNITAEQAEWLLQRAMYLKRQKGQHDVSVLAALIERKEKLKTTGQVIDPTADILELKTIEVHDE